MGCTGWRACARGAAETVGVVAGFVVLGLGWAAYTEAAMSGDVDGENPPEIHAVEDPSDPAVWLVDGFNVLHAVVLGGRDRRGFWRAAERQRLIDRVRGFDAKASEVWVVFDGPRPADEAEPDPDDRVHVVFAPSADEWLLRRVRGAEEPGAVAVVTRDRKLAGRSRHRGARVVEPRDFLRRCPL